MFSNKKEISNQGYLSRRGRVGIIERGELSCIKKYKVGTRDITNIDRRNVSKED